MLFGAFDRHNLGDLLFAHFALGDLNKRRSPTLAGTVAADLTAFGGHRVESLPEVLRRCGRTPFRLVHVGGEVLTCDRTVARITALPPGTAIRGAELFEPDGVARESRWIADPGFAAPAPYVVRCSALPSGSQTEFRAVGGVGIASVDEAMRGFVAAALREATYVTVRDARTRAALMELGICAALERDPVSDIRRRFGRRILDRVSRVGRGFLAVQASAEFGDDATLDRLAAQVDRIVQCFHLPVVLFRAGAAPWHDDLALLNRLGSRLAERSPTLFSSLDIWDICALIAGAAAVIGSSLHVRIVAEAFGRPAISLLGEDPSPLGQPAKVRAYLETWFADAPRLASVDELTLVVSAVMNG